MVQIVAVVLDYATFLAKTIKRKRLLKYVPEERMAEAEPMDNESLVIFNMRSDDFGGFIEGFNYRYKVYALKNLPRGKTRDRLIAAYNLIWGLIGSSKKTSKLSPRESPKISRKSPQISRKSPKCSPQVTLVDFLISLCTKHKEHH